MPSVRKNTMAVECDQSETHSRVLQSAVSLMYYRYYIHYKSVAYNMVDITKKCTTSVYTREYMYSRLHSNESDSVSFQNPLRILALIISLMGGVTLARGAGAAPNPIVVQDSAVRSSLGAGLGLIKFSRPF
jgi:hypothetical protein